LSFIYIGLQFIDWAYETQFFQNDSFSEHIQVLYAMYLA